MATARTIDVKIKPIRLYFPLTQRVQLVGVKMTGNLDQILVALIDLTQENADNLLRGAELAMSAGREAEVAYEEVEEATPTGISKYNRINGISVF